MKRDLSARVCVIGAGPSGITAIKNLLQAGLSNIVCYEKQDQVGGNWVFSPRLSHSSVYETTHVISSKFLSQYEDYPMPDDYPDYPSHKQMLDYFQGYAQHFGVMDYIEFNTCVERAEKQADESWKITLDDGRVESFDHLMVCNGHHWNPNYPNYQGEFSGQFLHSHDYKTAQPFRDQRVLVIGGGNSACDIAVETGRISAFTAISMRRGYWFVPKHMMGIPVDVLSSKFVWLPMVLRRPILRLALLFSTGHNGMYGLQHPDHPLLNSHPVANSELFYAIKHGRVHPRPDIERFDGQTVYFTDGTAEDYDVVVAATGFKISFPFFASDFIDLSGNDVPLYLRIFPAEHPTLSFIGLVQPQGSIWPLSDAHAKLVANYIAGRYDLPADIAQRIQTQVDKHRRTYLRTPRHSTEVDYHAHLNEVLREVPDNAPSWQGDRQPVL